ncbi:putative small lipoprotein YifL [Kushneria sinocarnis]|uniref:Putative small lipoprotein YifL n=1 Tax=Kushneria sinocarnis TaxID=595502 RepID=A0A420X178_9GAMM|nr:lipoprotein [Kushneria sinocarnis]RKR07459.1 putative small lipoprotein YifL [Kushneria sinocarnis]
MYYRLALCALALPLVLAGCGQKGPLYMPSDQQAQERYDPQDAYDEGSDSDSGQPRSSGAATPQEAPPSDADTSGSRRAQEGDTMPEGNAPGARDTGEQSSVPNIGSGTGTTTNPVGGPGGAN